MLTMCHSGTPYSKKSNAKEICLLTSFSTQLAIETGAWEEGPKRFWTMRTKITKAGV